MLVGSSEPTNDKYSVVSVGKDVTLEGWSGIFINHENAKSYGVHVNLEGKINAVNDISGGTGAGVYVNGNIKDKDYSPVVNIMDGAEIKSTGNGLYIAGYSTFNIGDAYIEGDLAAIGIKSGKLIIDGATLICNGEDKTPTEGHNNGIKASGTTIQIESNSGYKGNIELDISRGNFVSKNSNVIYEYTVNNNTNVTSINISNGKFISESMKPVFLLSDSFKNKHQKFITGGMYSSNPKDYLKDGYVATKNSDDLYEVTDSTGVFAFKNNSTNSFIIFLIIGIIGIISYFLFKFRIKTKL
jgi:hypothetical protein